jgi:hypothetical protein
MPKLYENLWWSVFFNIPSNEPRIAEVFEKTYLFIRKTSYLTCAEKTCVEECLKY